MFLWIVTTVNKGSFFRVFFVSAQLLSVHLLLLSRLLFFPFFCYLYCTSMSGTFHFFCVFHLGAQCIQSEHIFRFGFNFFFLFRSLSILFCVKQGKNHKKIAAENTKSSTKAPSEFLFGYSWKIQTFHVCACVTISSHCCCFSIFYFIYIDIYMQIFFTFIWSV